MRSFRSIAAAALCAACVTTARAQSAYEQLQTFSGLLNQIRLNYVDSVTTQQLVRGAIDGMLAALDPHSYFLAHDDARRLDAWRSGHLAATGIAVDEADGAIVVQSVYPRSPAERAGVSAGDRILAINDSSVAGLGAQKVQSRLIGERGSRVTIRLERGPRFEPETVSVRVRNEEIHPQAVTIARTLRSGAGYVRLAEFLPESGREVKNAINRVIQERPRRLILDLRGNPGGIISAAVDVASLFLASGQVVFQTSGRRADVGHQFKTERNGEFADLEMIVLIDQNSASAAEALAASLQDHDRALLAGRRSFGKALMQQMFMVPPNDDVVWLTVGYVLTPSGRMIQRRYHGLSTGQYYGLAGRTGAAEDTTQVLHTDGGRPVRGGGGIEPDTTLPLPPALPAWWTAAADSGFLIAVADSVANTLDNAPATRDRWIGAPEAWGVRLLPPLLARAHARLGVRGDPDSLVGDRMTRYLAARVAEVRWGLEAMEDLLVVNDPDIKAAASLFAVRAEMLGRHP